MATNATMNFTKAALGALTPPAAGQRLVYHDEKMQGLELRVTSTGAMTFSLRRRVRGGAIERVTIGPYPAISIELARNQARAIVGQQATGHSHATAKKLLQRSELTFAAALQAFVNDDTARPSPLKQRTRSDYLQMVRPAGDPSVGRKHAAGELHALAAKRLDALTGSMIKAHFKRLTDRGPTRAAYAMRVVRAVLNYHGVSIEDDPFARKTAKRDRIVLPAAKRRTRIIPIERLRDWWVAADNVHSGDAFQLLLLTGMRRGELGSIRCRDLDLQARRLHLHDTKSRRPHVVMLSVQALAIVRLRAADKTPDELLFQGVADPRKSLEAIIAQTGISFSAHDCRRTFGTIAASTLPGYVVKRLLNHSDGQDVTGAHYVHLDDATLAHAWQAVADFITGAQPSTPSRSPSNGVVVRSTH